MIHLFKKTTNECKHPLSPAEPTHRRWTIIDELEDLWVCNKNGIGLLIVTICISILLIMIGYAFANGNIHFLSTEANLYEHLEQVVL